MGDRYPDDYAAIRAYHAYATSLQLLDKDDDPILWDSLTTFEQGAWIAAAKAAYKAEAWVLSDQ